MKIKNWLLKSLIAIISLSCFLGAYTPVSAKPVKKKSSNRVVVVKKKQSNAPLPVVDDSPINPQNKQYIKKNTKPATHNKAQNANSGKNKIPVKRKKVKK